ncbi:MAG: VWA domain-containing protein [Spirochaetes bacterium]|nr:VWA domain-containing protein [Spirochaetota bacterium]
MLRKKSVSILTILFLIILTANTVYSDERTENIDIIIALDKSLSMVGKIDAVKDYVKKYIVDDMVIPGDYLLIIGFYGKTDILVSQKVKNRNDKILIKRIVSKIKADGHFTDIGNALDEVRKQLKKYSNDKRRKYVLLITDGKQEAPPSSKYYSPDGKFNHEFLKNTKIIQMKGWKIEVLGIGTETAAKELARQISGGYTQISEKPTEQEIKSGVKNLLSSIKITYKPEIIRIHDSGKGKFLLKLNSSGYKTGQSLTITGIHMQSEYLPETNILTGNITKIINPKKETELSIPVRVVKKAAPGDYKATLVFTFKGNIRFLPSAFNTTMHFETFMESYLWIIIIIAVIILAVVILIILKLAGLSGKKSVKFRVVIEETPLKKGKDTFRVTEGSNLFLNESGGMISLTERKTPKSIARFTARSSRLIISVLNNLSFPELKEIPDNALDHAFKVRSENGRDIHFRLEVV